MNRLFKYAPKLLLATASLLALSGCMTTDAMFGDLDHGPAHASDRYPITVVNGHKGPRAQVAACGNWNEDLTDTKQNTAYPNLGCAVQHNIAAELDNPATIDKPQVASVKNAEDGVAAVARQQATVNAVTIPSNYVYQ